LVGTLAVARGRARGPRGGLVLGALGIAGVLLGVLGEWAYAHTGASGVAMGRDLTIGWAFLGGGLLAWRRRPDNAWWRLLVAEGFAWFIPNLRGTGHPVLFAIGTVMGPVNDMIMLHMVAAFPSGRLGQGWRRRVVLGGYACAVVAGLVYMLMDDPASDWSPFACSPCRENALLLYPGPWPFLAVVVAGAAEAAAIAAATVALVVRLWATSTPAARRISAARWSAWTCCAVMLVTDAARNLPLPLSATGWGTLDWAGELSQAAIPLVLLLGALRARAATAAVGDLLVDLERRVSPGDLGATLSRALGDPSLQLGFWHPEVAGYSDAQGRPVRLPAGQEDCVIRLVTGSGQPLGVIVHDRALADLPGLVAAAGAAIRLGLENDRLRTELEARLQDVLSSRARIVEAADSARRQAERDLHDGAQQRLLGVGLLLERLQAQLVNGNGSAPLAAAAAARRELGTALEELRELARGIHPAILSQAGLAAALQTLAARSPVDVKVRGSCGRFGPSVEMTAYLVASESLANVAKHASASCAWICLEERRGRLFLEVADDGVGGADPAAGTGISGLADRVAAHGGTLQLQSPAGGGTRVLVELPCA
jgi:signal transduction histidine kinase